MTAPSARAGPQQGHRVRRPNRLRRYQVCDLAGKIVHRDALREGENGGAHRGREGHSGVDSRDARPGNVLGPWALVPAASLRTDTHLVLPELVAHLVDRV